MWTIRNLDGTAENFPIPPVILKTASRKIANQLYLQTKGVSNFLHKYVIIFLHDIILN